MRRGSRQIVAPGGGAGGPGGTEIVVSAGASSASLSAMTFSNSNGISFGLSAGTITGTVRTNYAGTVTAITGGSITVNTDGVSLNLPAYLTTAALSNHSHGNPTLNLTNLSGTTNSNSEGFTLSLSANAPFSGGVSGGNVAGDSGVVTNRLVFAGGNNITLSGSTNGGSMTITVSAFNQSVQTQMTGLSAGLSAGLGNTSGDTGIVSNRLVWAGGNNITLSGSTNGQSMTITISAPNLGAGNAFSAGISTQGNTAGTTGFISQQVQFVGSNGVTLSQSVNGNSATITVLDKPDPTIAYYDFMAHRGGQTGTASFAANSFTVVPFHAPFPGAMTVSTVMLRLTGALTATASSSSNTLSFYVGVYSRNAQTLSLMASGLSTLAVAAATANTGISHGPRFLTMHSSLFNANIALSEGGEYYIGFMARSVNFAPQFSYMYLGGHALGTQASGTLGFSTATNTSAQGHAPFLGIYSASTAGVPGVIATNDLNRGTAGIFQVGFIFNNQRSDF